MEGDMKELVLERLEQRLREKDDELRAARRELDAGGDAKALAERLGRLESDVAEVRIIQGEIMKKVVALEGAVGSMLMGMANGDEGGDEGGDLSSPGVPQGDQPFDRFAADRGGSGEDAHGPGDASRFFHRDRNA